MSRGVWKAVETKVGETRVVKTKEERKKRKKPKKKGEDNEDKEGSRKMGDLGWRRGSSKVRRRGKKAGVRMFSLVDSYLWKETE